MRGVRSRPTYRHVDTWPKSWPTSEEANFELFTHKKKSADTVRRVWRSLGSSNGATRPVPVQKVMVFCAFHDGDVNGREELAMAEKDQEPVISGEEEVLDGPWAVSKLKAFWRQRSAVLSGKKHELLQAVGEDFDFLDQTSVTMPRVGFVTSFHPFLF